MTTVVVPLDGTVFTERAIRPACSIASRLGRARVLLVSCAPDDIEAARTKVLHGGPGRTIPRFAERLPAALIALGAHGRSGLSRIAFGSVATEVVRHAPCPVLPTRPTAGEAHDPE